jgi:hypothetical protein
VIAAVRTPAETVSYSLTPLALYTLLALSLDRLGTAWSNVRTPADLASLPSVVEALAIPASVEIDPADRARIGRLAAALLGVLRGRVVLSPALAQRASAPPPRPTRSSLREVHREAPRRLRRGRHDHPPHAASARRLLRRH